VVAEDSVPPVFRASDADRDNVLDILRRSSVEGRLSYDTFLHRVELALQARGAGELSELLRDLPAQAQPPAWPVRAVRWWATFTAAIRHAWLTPRLPRLVLPRDERVFVIGRAPECDFVLCDMTVSWRHAELRPSAGSWVLADLNSKNGTRVNGWRAGAGFTVRAGDYVRFGRARFHLTE
jgi:FHA domain/DUF1707 SHOCT-like domain